MNDVHVNFLHAALCRATNGFHPGGKGLLHHDPEPFEKALLKRMKKGQFKMIFLGFCGLQDKDVSIVFLGMITVGLPLLLERDPFNRGTGCKINGYNVDSRLEMRP